MASFTDTIPQFNPYVQQLPVEAMVAVGTQKQQQYDQGIQRIQQSIDTIAGIDVASEVDKAYLQSKLNQLGNDLTSVAAGDFSNFQLVNSVDGMTKQLMYDKNIQTAISSTAALRKEQAKKEKAIQEGKSSPENEWEFNNGVSKYLQGVTPGEAFNTQFFEYKDVDSKLRDLAGKLKEIDSSIDNPYIRDNSGKTIYFNSDGTQSLDASKGGKPQYDMTMLTTKVKGIGAERILNNFYDSLDESDKRQLNITAKYHYRNSTPITFQNDIIKTYNEKKRIYSDAIVDASVKLAIGNLTPEQKTLLQNEINKAKELVYEGGLDKQMNEDMAAVDTEAEADAYKYKIYTQKYLTNLARDISNESISIEYKNNPGFQAIMDKKKFEFDVAKERQREREWQAKYVLDLRADARAEEESTQKKIELQPIVKDAIIKTNFDELTVENLDNEITSIESDINSSNLKLGELILPEGTIEQKIKAAKDLYTEYRTNPNTIDNNVQREILQQLDGLNNVYNNKNKIYKAAIDAGKSFEAEVDTAFSKEKGLRIGDTFFNAKDIYNFYKDSYGYVKRFEPVSTAYGATGSAIMTKDILEAYKDSKYYPIALAIYNNYNNQSLTESQKIIMNRIKNLNENISLNIRDSSQKQKQAQAQVINNLSPEFQAKDIVFNKKNTQDITTAEQVIGLKLDQYNNLGALDVSNPEDFIPAKVAEMQKDSNISYKLQKRSDGAGELVLTSGTTTQKIPLTAQELGSWFKQYSYINPITSIKYAVQSSPNKTTNEIDKVQASTAGITGFSPLLPNINNTKIAPKVRVDVEGSKSNNGGPNDKFQVRLYFKPLDLWQDKILNSGGYVNETGLQELLNAIGPKTIDTVFK
jgi:hypothetical protein